MKKIYLVSSLWVCFFSAAVLAGVCAAADPQTPTVQPSSDASGTLTLPAETKLMVQLSQKVSINKKAAGQKFMCLLQGNLTVGGQTVAADGAKIYGSVRQIQDPEGKPVMALFLDEIMLTNGQLQPMVTHPLGVKGPNAGAAAASGAVKGAVVGSLVTGGHGRGAGAGAMVGGVAASSSAKKNAAVPAGEILDFYLAEPLTVAAK